MRKLTSVSVALIVAAGVLTASPAHAVTISNGVACSKSGTTKTVSGRKYTCTKNPISTSTKLTWLSTDCLDAAKFYLKNVALLPAIKTSADASVTAIDVDILKAQADLAELTLNGPAKITALEAKVTVAKTKQAAALAKQNAPTVDPVSKAKYQVAVQQWDQAIKGYGRNIDALGPVGKAKIERAINRLMTYKSLAKDKYTNVRASVTEALGTAKMICAKGL